MLMRQLKHNVDACDSANGVAEDGLEGEVLRTPEGRNIATERTTDQGADVDKSL